MPAIYADIMKFFISLQEIVVIDRKGDSKLEKNQMIFENEEASRLLNYFISYKEIVCKNEKHTQDNITLELMPPQEITIE